MFQLKNERIWTTCGHGADTNHGAQIESATGTEHPLVCGSYTILLLVKKDWSCAVKHNVPPVHGSVHK